MVVKDLSVQTPNLAQTVLALNQEKHANVPELHYVGASDAFFFAFHGIRKIRNNAF